jgi:hypothetical protein
MLSPDASQDIAVRGVRPDESQHAEVAEAAANPKESAWRGRLEVEGSGLRAQG